MRSSVARFAGFVMLLAIWGAARVGAQEAPWLPSVFLEELTWTEIREAIDGGMTTVILPTAGTEQNGPHMVLGKHRFIVDHASERIARELGNALVAPSMVYVPEGSIDPPSGHMRYAGSITLPNEYFMKVVEYAARSLAAHGFTDIVFIGDSGGNQAGMSAVAELLNNEWASGATRVHFIGEYYREAGDAFEEWVVAQGVPAASVGSHAGVLDTSQLLYVAPQYIRSHRLAPSGGYEGSGVSGDPTLASREFGRVGIRFKVDTAVRRIREMTSQERQR